MVKFGNIAIDNFCVVADTYILTHCHADHMTGLKTWHGSSLYCSQMTAKILAKRGLGSISKPTNQVFDIIDRTSKIVRITFIDANHCPGAVMVVIEDPEDGNFVHTGDFRMCDAIRHNDTLRRLAGKVQHLFLDATFNVPWLPSKEASIDMLMELIREHHGQDIILHSHCLGDEEIISAIAGLADRRIVWWNQDRRQLLGYTHPGLLRELDVGRTNTCSPGAFIHIVRNTAERHRHQLVGVEVSCSTLWFKKEGFERFDMDEPIYEDEKQVWHVPFSMHSSRDEALELQLFLQASCSTTWWMYDTQQQKPEVKTEPGHFVPTTKARQSESDKKFIMRAFEAADKSVEFYTAVDAASDEEPNDLLEHVMRAPKSKRARTHDNS